MPGYHMFFFLVFLALCLGASPRWQLDIQLKAADITLQQVLSLSLREQNGVQEGEKVTLIMKFHAILAHITELLDAAPVERLHSLIDVAITQSPFLVPDLTMKQKAMLRSPLRVRHPQLWTIALQKQVKALFSTSQTVIMTMEALLRVKEALGNYAGWRSPLNPRLADDMHDVQVASAFGFCFYLSHILTAHATIESQRDRMVAMMVELMNRKATDMPHMVAQALTFFSSQGGLKVNLDSIHETIKFHLQLQTEKAAQNMIKAEEKTQLSRAQRRQKDRNKSKQVQEKVETSNDTFSRQMQVDTDLFDFKAEDQDSDEEIEAQNVDENDYQVDVNWKPSEIWKLNAKIVKAQHCRIYTLKPLLKRIQVRAPEFKVDSWSELLDPQFEVHWDDVAKLKDCVKVVKERNTLVHDGSLLKYLHDPDQVAKVTGIAVQNVRDLLSYNPFTTKSVTPATIDFASQILSEGSSLRAIYVLGLCFIITELLPSNLVSKYRPLLDIRAKYAHPPVTENDRNLLLVNEYLD